MKIFSNLFISDQISMYVCFFYLKNGIFFTSVKVALVWFFAEIVEKTFTSITYLISLCKYITFPLIKKLNQTGLKVIYP